jgi:hypothetical protein
LHYANRSWEINDSLTWVRGRHIVKTGGGLIFRSVDSVSTPGTFGAVSFKSIFYFMTDQPATYSAAMYRLPPLFQTAAVGRRYRYRQLSGFAEDTWRVNRQLVVNAGIRYEYFGAPVNTGSVKDVEVHLGAGSTFPEMLAGASLSVPEAGDQVSSHATGNVAPRVGFVMDLGERAPVVRGGYGIFFDHPFDNLTAVATNNILVPADLACSRKVNSIDTNICGVTTTNPQGYLAPVSTMLSILKGTPFAQIFPALTLIDPGLRDGYTQSFFLAAEKRFSDHLDVEVNTLGALGRRLFTTDVVNRANSTQQDRYNKNLPDIQWRSSQGASNYQALTAVVRYRSPRGNLQASYTWSHAIDNQSDPLLGDFFDLSFVSASSATTSRSRAAFTTQFDSGGDRASSDFDQRHNLVFYSWWNVPAAGRGGVFRTLTRNWRVAEMAAFRSGFPYTVRSGNSGGDAVLNQRADIVDAAHISAPEGAPAAPGSVALLNKAAFAAPANGVVGNSGRNAFAGPGLWNVDLSVSRTFGLPRLGERRRLILRADLYNALNHANLNNPDARVGSPTFGQASYGRLDYNNGFPALVPLVETPRQIQILLKLEF